MALACAGLLASAIPAAAVEQLDIEDPYTANSMTHWLHSRPRWDSKFNPATNTPPESAAAGGDVQASLKYGTALGMQGAMMIGFGAALVVASLLLWIWTACKRGMKANGSTTHPHQQRTARLSTLVIGVIVLAAAITLGVSTAKIGSASKDASSALDNAYEVLSATAGSGSSVAQAMQTVRQTITDARSEINSLPPEAQGNSDVQDLQAQLSQMESSLASASGDVQTALARSGEIADVLSSASTDVRTTGSGLAIGGAGAAAASVLAALPSVAVALAPGMATTVQTYMWTSPFLTLASAGMWTAGASLYSSSLLLSDVCVAPESTLVSVVTPTSDSSSDSATFLWSTTQYYLLQCPRAGVPSKSGQQGGGDSDQNLVQVLASADSAASTLVQAAAQVRTKTLDAVASMRAARDQAGRSDPSDQQLDQLQNTAQRGYSSATSVADAISSASEGLQCDSIMQQVWLPLRTAICPRGLEAGSAPSFIAAVITVCFLSIILALGSMIVMCNSRSTRDRPVTPKL